MTGKIDSICYFILKRIEDIGTAQEMLNNITANDIFNNLSEYNPYWHSEHVMESEKLNEIRVKLIGLDEELWDLYAILKEGSFYDR